jgi:hypothetical protein
LSWRCALVALALDGSGEALGKARGRAQQAGVAGTHDGPQLAETVLHRRAGQGQAEAGPQREYHLAALGGGVLDGLGLFQHQRAPAPGGKGLGVDLQQRIRHPDKLAGRAGPASARASSTARACSVLPRPMSSARQAPSPAWASRIAHSKPSS